MEGYFAGLEGVCEGLAFVGGAGGPASEYEAVGAHAYDGDGLGSAVGLFDLLVIRLVEARERGECARDFEEHLFHQAAGV